MLQIDDVYGHGDEKFLTQEEEESQRFLCKPRNILKNGDSAQFNGSRISMFSNTIRMDQSAKLKSIKKPTNKGELVSVIAQI